MKFALSSLLLFSLLLPFSVNAQVIEEISRVNLSWDGPHDLVVVDEYAYLACGYAGVQVLDISDPTEPTIAGFCDTDVAVYWIDTLEDELVALGRHYLYKIDISNPEEPEITSTIGRFRYAIGLTAYDNLIYVYNWEEFYWDDPWGGEWYYEAYFSVIDSDDNATNSPRIRYDPDRRCHVDMIAEDGLLYMTGFVSAIWDLTDLNQPLYEEEHEWETATLTLELSDETLFRAGYNVEYRLSAYDVSEHDEPELQSSIELPSRARDLKIIGNHLFVICYNYRLLVVDIEDPENMEIITEFDLDRRPHRMDVSGDNIVVIKRQSASILDISDLDNISEVGDFRADGLSLDIALQGDYAYLAAGYRGLMIFDKSDPSELVLVGEWDEFPYIDNVNVSGDIAIFANNQNDSIFINFADVSELENPELLGSLLIEGKIRNLQAKEMTFYLVNYSPYDFGNLLIVDFSDPNDPSVVGSIPNSYNYTISDNRMFVSRRGYSVTVYDISQPNHPEEIETLHLPSFPHDPEYAWLIGFSSPILVDNFLYAYVRFVFFDEYSPGAEPGFGTYLYAWNVSNQDSIFIASNPNTLDYSDILTYTDRHLICKQQSASDWPEVYDTYLVFNNLFNRRSPRTTISFNTPGTMQNLAMDGDIAYIADYTNLGVYDCSEALSAPSDFISPPSSFILLEAYPNPFNSSTTIRFTIPKAGPVSLTVYDVLGRRVRDLTPQGWFEAGEHHFEMNLNAESSGTYFLKLQGVYGSETTNISLLK